MPRTTWRKEIAHVHLPVCVWHFCKSPHHICILVLAHILSVCVSVCVCVCVITPHSHPLHSWDRIILPNTLLEPKGILEPTVFQNREESGNQWITEAKGFQNPRNSGMSVRVWSFGMKESDLGTTAPAGKLVLVSQSDVTEPNSLLRPPPCTFSHFVFFISEGR